MHFTIEPDKTHIKIKPCWPQRTGSNGMNVSGGNNKGVSGIGPTGKTETPVGSRVDFKGAPPGTMNNDMSKSPRSMSNPINRTTGTKYDGDPVSKASK